MENMYRVQFKSFNKKLSKKFRLINEKGVYGVFEVQQILSELQKSITSIEKLTLLVKNIENSLVLEFDNIYIDPSSKPFQVLDEIQKQLLEAGDDIDGAEIYTALNRQYNNEMTMMPAPKEKRKFSLVAILSSFLKKEPETFNGVPPYAQPFMDIADTKAKQNLNEVVHAEPVYYDYQMLFRLKGDQVIECSFESEHETLERNAALKKYFTCRGKTIQIEDQEINISDIEGIRLVKVDVTNLFQLPEDVGDYDYLVGIPE